MVGHYNLAYNRFFIGAGKERDQNLHLLYDAPAGAVTVTAQYTHLTLSPTRPWS